MEFYKHSKDFIITYKASPNDSTFYDGEGVGREGKGPLEKPGEPLRYLLRSVKIFKAPPSRAILTLIVNLEGAFKEGCEPGCRVGGGRRGRGGGGEREGKGKTGRNSERGSGEGEAMSRAGARGVQPAALLL